MPTFIQQGFKQTRTKRSRSTISTKKKIKNRKNIYRRKRRAGSFSSAVNRNNDTIIRTTGTIATAALLLGAMSALKR